MRIDRSIRARLVLGGMVVLLAFMAGAGLALQRAHEDSVRTARFARLQSTVYLLLAGAELDASGALAMPTSLAEPRLTLPGSGLYANIFNTSRREEWQSASTVGVAPPFQRALSVGQWRYEVLAGTGASFLAASYGVKWSDRGQATALVFSVLEDKSEFDREMSAFGRTLWIWLGSAAVLLLLTQTVLLEWGLAPLRRVTREVRRIENGEQSQIEGRYPTEIAGLTDNLNTLIAQERVRQARYKEALSFLAHSLKTPLAVLRTALDQPAQLPAMVAQQVTRMDDIVRHQLGRAAASGSATFAPQLPIAPVLNRIRDSLEKVYFDKQLVFSLDCPPELSWRIDEGDAFELLGNVLDNAAKWAGQRVSARAWQQENRLHIRVEDDGPGFTDMQSVLKLHVRMDEQVPGHGIGLAVVNDLVASYRGELKLGQAESGGARVEIVLPAA